jgi:hypothetical protein
MHGNLKGVVTVAAQRHNNTLLAVGRVEILCTQPLATIRMLTSGAGRVGVNTKAAR